MNNTLQRFRVELVWNREFDWCAYRLYPTEERAIAGAISIRDSGDGAGVKKVRVVDTDIESVVWEG